MFVIFFSVVVEFILTQLWRENPGYDAQSQKIHSSIHWLSFVIVITHHRIFRTLVYQWKVSLPIEFLVLVTFEKLFPYYVFGLQQQEVKHFFFHKVLIRI